MTFEAQFTAAAAKVVERAAQDKQTQLIAACIHENKEGAGTIYDSVITSTLQKMFDFEYTFDCWETQLENGHTFLIFRPENDGEVCWRIVKTDFLKQVRGS